MALVRTKLRPETPAATVRDVNCDLGVTRAIEVRIMTVDFEEG